MIDITEARLEELLQSFGGRLQDAHAIRNYSDYANGLIADIRSSSGIGCRDTLVPYQTRTLELLYLRTRILVRKARGIGLLNDGGPTGVPVWGGK